MIHRYFIKTPWWVRKIFSSYVWHIPVTKKEIFLTFDDGPHPEITPWVLQELKKYYAKATFFCIGNNVAKYPQVYKEILEEGHAVGNHTYHHLNGWKTSTPDYVNDVAAANKIIVSNLFRPPYGRIKKEQAKRLNEAMRKENVHIIMWDVLSADFDKTFSATQCVRNVVRNVRKGSVIVFHDSEKAFSNLREVLPIVLESLYREGYESKKIVM